MHTYLDMAALIAINKVAKMANKMDRHMPIA